MTFYNPNTLLETILFDPFFLNEDKPTTNNISKTENGYILESYLPGMNKKNLSIDIEEDIITIDGKFDSKDKSITDMSYNFFKKYKIPTDVDSTKISANIKDGILRINFPYSEIKKSKKRTIQL